MYNKIFKQIYYEKSYNFINIWGFTCIMCIAKKFTELEELQQSTKDLLDSTTVKLNVTSEEKRAALAQLATLTEQNKFLKENNQDLIDNIEILQRFPKGR